VITVTVGTSAVVGLAIGGTVAAIGGTIAVGGTGTVVGTHIANVWHNESLQQKVQEAMDEYRGYRDDVVKAWKKVENMCHAISVKVNEYVEAILKYVWQIYQFAKNCKDIGKIVKKMMSLGAPLVPTILANIPWFCIGLAAVVGTGACAFNIYQLVMSAKVIHKDEPHPAAKKIRNKAIVDLDNEMKKFKELNKSLDDKCTS